ncbi:glycosyltransferase family 2 protein [Sandarakinorhabdus sp.]|jgi:dolichol-phosphate mannosyltransferase|uniref:glycosyltransferase family 2 protein n=1 Tax=Sandarakinorhabdus sp. TaxID=1916663 RepID=UPI0028B17255|nr:glycosyltransferase family 2 protein [Sandarakinorhabdus sp.]
MVGLSVVIPCYNEEACLPELHRRVAAVAHQCVGDDHEIVLINDGSRDRTWAIMQELAATDPNLVCLNLARNHGHQLALTAGLDLSRGKTILVIDADLQDPPELLPDMLQAMAAQGADVVYGLRTSREGESFTKKFTAGLFYRILDRLTDINIPLDTGDFRLMSRRALDVLMAMPEQARFVRGMVAWIGYRQVPFPYARAQRLAGVTHYPFTKMLSLAFDAITGFSTKPLRFASHAGLWLVGLLVLVAIYILGKWLAGGTVEGWTSLSLLIIGIGAAQMLVLGVIGEYLGRVYVEAKRRPLYIVAEVVGSDRPVARLGVSAAATPAAATPAPAATAPVASAPGQSGDVPG